MVLARTAECAAVVKRASLKVASLQALIKRAIPCFTQTMHLVFVTGNEHKVREVCEILPKVSIAHRQVDLPEIQGDIESIAREKAKCAAKALHCSVLVEDCALCFSAFGNALPGPYIKEFVKSIGTMNLPRLLSGWADKKATAVCTFAMCTFPELEVAIFQGKTSVQNNGLSLGRDCRCSRQLGLWVGRSVQTR